MLWLCVNIYHQITRQQNNATSWAQIKLAFNGPQTWKIIVAVLLMFVNWAIEALKWQKLIAPLQKLSFWTAYKATFAGTSFAANTPNRMGEYFGRMIYIDEGKRLQSIPLTITGSFSQLLVTLSFGCVGLFFFMSLVHQSVVQFSISSFWLKIFLIGTVLVTIVSYFVYFKLNWLVKIIRHIPFLKKYIFFFEKIDELNNKLLLKILGLSALRYIVFIAQYLLIMQAFGLQLVWLQNVYLLQVLFLVMSIIPSFVIMEAGIRGKVSIEIFKLVTTNNVAVLASGLFIWLLNLMAPALLGVLFLVGKKVFKK
jgi:hypothetical protein